MFALADGNNFFVSCERVFQPKYDGKPTLVLSNNDGCVIARSAEVKALGVPMGVPYFKVKDLCVKAGVKIFSSNFRLYGDMSGRMMSVMKEEVLGLHPYSIDEAFLDLGEAPLPRLVEDMKALRARVKRETGLPVCIGVAPTKTLAKAANHYAKKHAETGGVYGVCEGNREEVLRHMMVGDLWGIGPNLEASLNRMKVATALDLAQCDPREMRRRFNVYMEQMVLEIRGTPCFGLSEGMAKYPTIQATRSFGRPVTELEELEEAVASYASRASVKMRERNLRARAVLVYIKTNKHKPHLPQYGNSHMVALPHATGDTTIIIAHAIEALRAIFKEGFAYKKAGVWLNDLVDGEEHQKELFSVEDRAETDKLMAAMDAVNHRFGQHTVQAAACGLRKDWAMRSELRSPDYTTKWEDVMRVRA